MVATDAKQHHQMKKLVPGDVIGEGGNYYLVIHVEEICETTNSHISLLMFSSKSIFTLTWSCDSMRYYAEKVVCEARAK